MAELKQEVQIGWQVFQRRDAMSEYVTLSGREIDLVRFDALCATCGRPFMGKATKGNWRNKNLARRCQRHRQPGVWVDNDEPPIPIENMPLWARPKSWIKNGSGTVRKTPKKATRPRKHLQHPLAEPPTGRAHPSYLD